IAQATTPATPLTGHRFPIFLPDGHRFFYLNRTLADFSQWGIDVASVDSGDVTRVMKPPIVAMNVAYASGRLIFVGGGTLFAQPFDPARLALSGEAATIAEHVGHDSGTGAMFSVSENGVLVFRMEAAPPVMQLTWVDRSGRNVGTIGSPASQEDLALSRDGSRVAVSRRVSGSADLDLWVENLVSGAASRLTSEGGNFSPVWSPDGHDLAFGTQRHG